MATATNDVYIKMAHGDISKYAVEAAEIIYDGALVGSNGSGYAQAFAAGDVFLGICVDGQVDNSAGAAGALDVLVRSKAIIYKAVAGVASIEDIGKKVYATDDSVYTIVPTQANASACVGFVDVFVSSGYAYVRIDTDAQMSEGLGLESVAPVPAQITTAGNVTYTIEQLLAGLILRDPGAARSDVTPTAALIVAGIPNAKVGMKFEFVIQNDAGGAETITLTAGADVTLSGTMTIAQSNSKRFLVEITDISATEAVTIYSLGTFVF